MKTGSYRIDEHYGLLHVRIRRSRYHQRFVAKCVVVRSCVTLYVYHPFISIFSISLFACIHSSKMSLNFGVFVKTIINNIMILSQICAIDDDHGPYLFYGLHLHLLQDTSLTRVCMQAELY